MRRTLTLLGLALVVLTSLSLAAVASAVLLEGDDDWTGSFDVSFTPANFDGDATDVVWRIRHVCAAGGDCVLRVRSSTGKTYRYSPVPGGMFRWIAPAERKPSGDCVDKRTGQVLARHAYFSSYRATIRPRAVRDDGTVTRFSGVISNKNVPSGRARARGCRRSPTYRERIAADRR